MKRFLWILVVLTVLSSSSFAGPVENYIKSRWLGAWVVTSVEAYSDCSTSYTNNRINGNLVGSGGRFAFGTGELAKLDRVNAHRSRLDVHLSLVEPLLIPYTEGPFTLYREAHCKIEFEVRVPREVIKRADVDAVERALGRIVERHTTRDDAMDSARWNGREIEPYPEDYDLTLAELEIWRAERTNAAVQAKLDQAAEETSRLTDRLSSDADYLSGFAKGVEAARSTDLATCANLLAVKLAPPRRAPQAKPSASTAAQTRSTRGYADGKNLVYGLEILRRLGGCFVPVPELAAVEVGALE